MVKNSYSRHFLISDTIALWIAAYGSFVLRLEALNLGRYWLEFLLFAALSMLLTPLIFFWKGIYRHHWHYASEDELTQLSIVTVEAVALVGMLSLGVNMLVPGVTVPRSIPFIFLPLAIAGVAAPRLAIRAMLSYVRRYQRNSHAQRVLVMGAGDAGSMIVRELQHNLQLGMEVIGFLDDDPDKHSLHIRGVPVLGNRHDIPRIAEQYGISRVIIAIPTAPGKAIREIVAICEKAGVQTKTIPGIYELLDGKVSLNQLRDVQIEDLLRRQPIQTDTAAVRDLIHGRRVLITGGGGSIGSELCRQVLHCEPAELVVLGHGENSVFEIHNQLLKQASSYHTPQSPCRISAVIADVRFPERIQAIFEEYRPDIVFHAAAHKHVPLMELNPTEAISNNIMGTRIVLDAALATQVRHFVMISTDKAVNPTSIMGASKRVCELLVHQAAITSGRPYVAVRFGNVLGSRGSVVLTFKQQIASGGPVTITHPEMRRYFMTIPEAVQLVLQAAAIGQGGEVFTLDMGEPIRILDLARDMIQLSGLELGRDIDIVFTGLRPGEKLYEELFVPGEIYQRTVHEKIFIAHNASRFIPPHLNILVEELRKAAEQNDTARIVQLLQALVPELRRPAQESAEVETQGRLQARALGG